MIWTKHKRYMSGRMRWTDNPFEFHSLWKCSKESSEESIMLVYKKKLYLENASSLSSMLDKLKAFLCCCLSTLLKLFKRWPWFWWENVIGNKVIVPSQPRPPESSKVKIAKRGKLDSGWLHSHCNLWCTSAQSQQRRLFSFSPPFLLSSTIPSRIKITFWHHHHNCQESWEIWFFLFLRSEFSSICEHVPALHLRWHIMKVWTWPTKNNQENIIIIHSYI